MRFEWKKSLKRVFGVKILAKSWKRREMEDFLGAVSALLASRAENKEKKALKRAFLLEFFVFLLKKKHSVLLLEL